MAKRKKTHMSIETCALALADLQVASDGKTALQDGSICLSASMIFTQLKSTEANTDKCQWKVMSGVQVNPQWEAAEELTQGLIEGARLTAWLRDREEQGKQLRSVQ